MELVTADMYMPEMLWSLYFIQNQGYKPECVGLYQDDISTQLLVKNGKFSSGKKTKHVKAKFFLIKDWVDNGEIKVIDCPAEEMWADILTRCDACLGESKSNAVNLILRLFLYYFLHTMSS